MDDALMPSLVALINAMPWFADPAFLKVHRETLLTIIKTSLPAVPIAPEPRSSQAASVTAFAYVGPYANYRDAFFPFAEPTSASRLVALLLGDRLQVSVGGPFWSGYAVAILSRAIQLETQLPLKTAAIMDDLTGRNETLLTALSASYLGVFVAGYGPTATAYQAIVDAGQDDSAQRQLAAAISAGRLNATINESLAEGPDATVAATWFLFNLWIALTALGHPDVDAVIRSAQAAGLKVPVQVSAGKWWDGGYTSWYTPLDGGDLRNTPLIQAVMPQKKTFVVAGRTVMSLVDTPIGYSKSFTLWWPAAPYARQG